MMANDWARPKTLKEETVMIAKARTARMIITVGYSLMAIALIVVVAMSACGTSMRHMTNITDPGRPLPVQTYYVYDVTESPQYELTLTAQGVVMFLCVMPYTGIDNFLSLLVFHVAGQLDILKNRLEELDRAASFADALKHCVMDHVRLLRYRISFSLPHRG